uniref:Uncharacterized protein n=1 Tax=Setaria italica TaxID=4555 RepID=K3XPA6_SETIT
MCIKYDFRRNTERSEQGSQDYKPYTLILYLNKIDKLNQFE